MQNYLYRKFISTGHKVLRRKWYCTELSYLCVSLFLLLFFDIELIIIFLNYHIYYKSRTLHLYSMLNLFYFFQYYSSFISFCYTVEFRHCTCGVGINGAAQSFNSSWFLLKTMFWFHEFHLCFFGIFSCLKPIGRLLVDYENFIIIKN